jgi:glycosyltransferase involved in cell wall biosynthesis
MTAQTRSVLLVTPRWTRDGGVATHAIASAAALAERGIEVSVLAARVEERELAPGIAVHHAPDLFKAADAAGKLGAAGRALRAEVVHMHQFDDPAVVSYMRREAPVVISCHGYSACTSGVHYFAPGEECTRAHGPGCVSNLLLRGCAHTRDPRPLPASYARATRAVRALRDADLTISYSTTIDRHLARNGVERRAIVPLFSTTPVASAAGHGTRRRVVFAGRVIAPKGVGVLLAAARELDAELVICGDGRELTAMRERAGRLGIGARVTFTGWLGPTALAQALAEASVVALPALWPEPFGLVGIEAHAAGRPVVASATGGVRDWLNDGVSGLLAAPGDVRALASALATLLADPARQETMGAAGRASVAARFTPERHVAALIDAYAAARRAWVQRTHAGTRGSRAAAPVAPTHV